MNTILAIAILSLTILISAAAIVAALRNNHAAGRSGRSPIGLQNPNAGSWTPMDVDHAIDQDCSVTSWTTAAGNYTKVVPMVQYSSVPAAAPAPAAPAPARRRARPIAGTAAPATTPKPNP